MDARRAAYPARPPAPPAPAPLAAASIRTKSNRPAPRAPILTKLLARRGQRPRNIAPRPVVHKRSRGRCCSCECPVPERLPPNWATASRLLPDSASPTWTCEGFGPAERPSGLSGPFKAVSRNRPCLRLLNGGKGANQLDLLAFPASCHTGQPSRKDEGPARGRPLVAIRPHSRLYVPTRTPQTASVP